MVKKQIQTGGSIDPSMPRNKQERTWIRSMLRRKGRGKGRGERKGSHIGGVSTLFTSFAFTSFAFTSFFFTFVGLGLSWPRALRICSSNALISLGGTAP